MVYGFEGDDIITGNGGTNRLFGDGGDDLIILANTPTRIGDAIPGSFSTPSTGNAGATSYASGGSGNDHII